jgi:hypothetical protein
MSKSNLVTHADYELKLAGLDKKDSDYNGELYKAVMKLIKVFSKQGHSGYSAGMVIELFSKLARFKNITPIGQSLDEWVDVSEASGKPMWQNRRSSSLFSTDGGKTYYDLDEEGRPIHTI